MQRSPLRILIVATRIPSHLRTGDRLRLYRLIQGLRQHGHHVDLVGFDSRAHEAESDIDSLCSVVTRVYDIDIDFVAPSRLKQLGETLGGAWHGLPRRVWQFRSTAMARAVSAHLSSKYYDIVHFCGIGIADLIRLVDRESGPACVIDYIDAVSMSVSNSLKFRLDFSWPFRLFEATMLRRYEGKLLGQVDAACVVSSRDKAYLGNDEHLHVVPVAIAPIRSRLDTIKDIDLIFTGNMYTRSNEDAVCWFVSNVWPKIAVEKPDVTFYVVGRNPTCRVRSLSGAGIVVTGAVDDIGHYLERSRVFVAPLRYGAGQKTKLLDALSYGLPVVATSEANAGTDAPDSVIRVCNTASEMAASILRLLSCESERSDLARSAAQFVSERFSMHYCTELLEDVYREAIARAHALRPPLV